MPVRMPREKKMQGWFEKLNNNNNNNQGSTWLKSRRLALVLQDPPAPHSPQTHTIFTRLPKCCAQLSSAVNLSSICMLEP